MEEGPERAARRGVQAAIALLLFIPVLVPLLAVLLIWLMQADASRTADQRVTSASRLVRENFRSLVNETRERLVRIDRALGPDPAAFSLANIDTGPGIVGLYDAAGDTITRSGTRGANVATNDAFQALAKGKSLVITPLISVQGAIRLFGVAHRIERNGMFAGVITAYFPADYLSDLWSTLSLGPDSTVGLIRDDGWQIARYPVPENPLNLSDYQLFTRELKASPSGVYSAKSPVDGHLRRVGYQLDPDLGVIAVASLSQTSATTALWSRVRSSALVTAPIFLALVFMCGWVVLLLLRQERTRGNLAAALAENKTLLQEIHHRVKNNLQSVIALVRLQEAPDSTKTELAGRIAAISKVHEHIYETDQFGQVDAAGFLEKLLPALAGAAPPGVDLVWRIAPFDLAPGQAMPLGLLVNELVTNAFKHAFPDGRTGKVEVTLTKEDSAARLVVADNGVGAAGNGGEGLGTRLISSFVTQLQGEMTTHNEAGRTVEVIFEA
ncbi:MAG: hypothetical protein GC155_15065 [Alphaproteobacteria bacterium]|nr:hypothetical protein [Alphaproteobacteria bacterium]